MSKQNDVKNKFLEIGGETINLKPPDMPELPEGYNWYISKNDLGYGIHYWYLEIGIWKSKKKHWWSSTETEYFHSFKSCSIFFDDSYKEDYSSVQEYIRVKAEYSLSTYAKWIKASTEKDIVVETINDYRRS